MKKFVLLAFLFFGVVATAATPAPAVHLSTLNQVILSEGGTSWTARDFKLYKKLIKSLVKKDRLTELSKDLPEDFIISRLLKREAVLFEIQPSKIEIHNSDRDELSEFSKDEIAEEITAITYADALLNLKETQASQKARFKAWIDVLKRKYAVKVKTSDFG